MSNYSRVFLYLFILVITLTLIKNILNKGLTSFKEGCIGTVNKIIYHETDTDIAIFGSSVALVHFNPKIIENYTNLTSYNYGLDGTTALQYSGLVNEYLTYSKSKYIIIASTIGEFKKRSEYYALYRFLAHSNNPNIYFSLAQINPSAAFRLRYLPFYEFTRADTRTLKIALEGLRNKPYPSDETSSYNGYSPRETKWESDFPDQRNTNLSFFQEEIDSTVVSNFKNMINNITNANKKVILVFTPIYLNGQESVENIEEIKSIYRNLADNNNVIFYDFTSSKICKNKDLFYNNTHLNAIGASEFSKEFALNFKEIINQENF